MIAKKKLIYGDVYEKSDVVNDRYVLQNFYLEQACKEIQKCFDRISPFTGDDDPRLESVLEALDDLASGGLTKEHPEPGDKHPKITTNYTKKPLYNKLNRRIKQNG